MAALVLDLSPRGDREAPNSARRPESAAISPEADDKLSFEVRSSRLRVSDRMSMDIASRDTSVVLVAALRLGRGGAIATWLSTVLILAALGVVAVLFAYGQLLRRVSGLADIDEQSLTEELIRNSWLIDHIDDTEAVLAAAAHCLVCVLSAGMVVLLLFVSVTNRQATARERKIPSTSRIRRFFSNLYTNTEIPGVWFWQRYMVSQVTDILLQTAKWVEFCGYQPIPPFHPLPTIVNPGLVVAHSLILAVDLFFPVVFWNLDLRVHAVLLEALTDLGFILIRVISVVDGYQLSLEGVLAGTKAESWIGLASLLCPVFVMQMEIYELGRMSKTIVKDSVAVTVREQNNSITSRNMSVQDAAALAYRAGVLAKRGFRFELLQSGRRFWVLWCTLVSASFVIVGLTIARSIEAASCGDLPGFQSDAPNKCLWVVHPLLQSPPCDCELARIEAVAREDVLSGPVSGCVSDVRAKLGLLGYRRTGHMYIVPAIDVLCDNGDLFMEAFSEALPHLVYVFASFSGVSNMAPLERMDHLNIAVLLGSRVTSLTDFTPAPALRYLDMTNSVQFRADGVPNLSRPEWQHITAINLGGTSFCKDEGCMLRSTLPAPHKAQLRCGQEAVEVMNSQCTAETEPELPDFPHVATKRISECFSLKIDSLMMTALHNCQTPPRSECAADCATLFPFLQVYDEGADFFLTLAEFNGLLKLTPDGSEVQPPLFACFEDLCPWYFEDGRLKLSAAMRMTMDSLNWQGDCTTCDGLPQAYTQQSLDPKAALP